MKRVGRAPFELEGGNPITLAELRLTAVESDSMINLRPSRENQTRGVEGPAIRERILAIVGSIVIA